MHYFLSRSPLWRGLFRSTSVKCVLISCSYFVFWLNSLTSRLCDQGTWSMWLLSLWNWLRTSPWSILINVPCVLEWAGWRPLSEVFCVRVRWGSDSRIQSSSALTFVVVSVTEGSACDYLQLRLLCPPGGPASPALVRNWLCPEPPTCGSPQMHLGVCFVSWMYCIFFPRV